METGEISVDICALIDAVLVLRVEILTPRCCIVRRRDDLVARQSESIRIGRVLIKLAY